MIRVIMAACLMFIFVANADARPWRRGRNVQSNVNSKSYSSSPSYSGGPQQVAESKARRSAASGIKGHLGGGFGGANAEGVGFSTSSAQHALNICCFTGQRSVAGSSVVRGADGWYAVKIYW